eukprot:TRINITY_DN115849_c0_g1_i1.p1 TRINITY_DN115849_c0_g1~~TRINITY_DN115849_c0_g1_i1.p1  ORF type:complete len:322 (+),score=70.22 TRINITY_DN115849_c0_g1_i1:3-968(+)
MARSVADCAVFFKTLVNSCEQRQDSTVVPLPFDDAAYMTGVGALEAPRKKFRVGLIKSDGWFKPCAATQRALDEAASGLRSSGVEVVPLELPAAIDGWEVARLYYGLMAADGNMKGLTDALEGESMIPLYKELYKISNLPNFLRLFLRTTVLPIRNDLRKQRLLGVTASGGLSVRQYWKFAEGLQQLKKGYAELLQGKDLDALLLPVAALPALPHGASATLTPIFTYCMLANLLQWPAGAVPVTTVAENEAKYHCDADLPENQRDSLARFARKAMDTAKGLPVGVQVVTPPFKDERCLHFMQLIEKTVAFSAKPQAAKSLF